MASKARAFQQACRTRGQAIPFSRPEKSQLSYSTYAPITPFASTCPHISSPKVSPCAAPSLSHRHTRHASTSTNSSNKPPRRAITVTSDDGRYNWSELSTSEKAARGTQQTFNFVIVAAGLVGTITISYLLYQELLAPDSSTVQFNAAVSRIKSSPECRALLGPSSQITAYGEPTSNKWARARPLAHSAETDRFGTTHFRMHFNVSGPDGTGVVTVHMTKPRVGDRLEYQLLSLTVKGHETVYLENKDAERSVKGRVGKMFGVQWR
ncbi:mitochondrial import inner membrane translocase subunit tim21 [Exophiala xenobiotica]|nr:mitochondrial import inner membrane translocase subunit tim21 [Exophiala xenobiotica]KAK5264308.1 mitochondrial import inner membrane translocase subunit tim21 [Exophiala xenobiotica]KAK5333214.1 mitochondrial import inner membrane translocase subunit tim21 [Exophiala xenobiotica]KAK5369383.1 mitochondrial import inner membrane translocase subunit tim21 [Exophiala xenobiotica]KAK5394732.1 mitochondrial import inner membrane translocase subunit tim21 [Exophiala xenobiotica]